MTVFDIEAFVASCVDASEEPEPVDALREVVQRAVSSPHMLDARFPATGLVAEG